MMHLNKLHQIRNLNYFKKKLLEDHRKEEKARIQADLEKTNGQELTKEKIKR